MWDLSSSGKVVFSGVPYLVHVLKLSRLHLSQTSSSEIPWGVEVFLVFQGISSSFFSSPGWYFVFLLFRYFRGIPNDMSGCFKTVSACVRQTSLPLYF